MLARVLIANRGAIAVRILRTLKARGIRSYVIYSDADRDSLHVQLADVALPLGDGPLAETYLNIDAILALAIQHKIDAIHPGYGFLSENPAFVSACEQQSIRFIGPTAEQIQAFGLKHTARTLAQQANCPLLPGSDLLTQLDDALAQAEFIGYPVMLKSTAGGGGIGMQRVDNADALTEAFASVKRLSQQNFANDGVFLEKFIAEAKHIEVQLIGDGQGQVVCLGERDCSSQRRHQKVIEEAPAPGLDPDVRQAMLDSAQRLAASVNYRNAGTVEFIYDQQSQGFYFLEVNTRLQVEHGVTEQIYQLDIVDLMLDIADAQFSCLEPLQALSKPNKHAIQLRLYAESAAHDFRPSTGLLTQVSWPEASDLRIDTWVQAGIEVSANYDPMLAKIIVTAASRTEAIKRLQTLLADCQVYGVTTNLDYLAQLIQQPSFINATISTGSLAQFTYQPQALEVLRAGTLTTIQDYPARTGYWHIGVPPSGPFDSYHFRLGNRLLGQDEGCAGLEITLDGPRLQFHCDSRFVLAGADCEAWLDAQALHNHCVYQAKAGQILDIAAVASEGARCYLLLAGGIDCPDYLGSKSTFTLGQFGGHSGRALRAGDMLSIDAVAFDQACFDQQAATNDLQHSLAQRCQLQVIYGPHGAPDFFTENDIAQLLQQSWTVHYNSSRTGIRLIGPKPEWARDNGGEAGLHPSNIHDNAYAIGAVDFTGDMPVILGPDGPSLGGFVCPLTVIQADLWKLGQLRAGDQIQFIPVEQAQAVAYHADLRQALLKLEVPPPLLPPCVIQHQALLRLDQQNPQVTYRSQGDAFLLIEYGEMQLDIALRFRVHALMLSLQEANIPGVLELTPGIRSLQVHYQAERISQADLLQQLVALESGLAPETLTVPSRIVHLPLSWDDAVCQQASAKYQQSVRPDAPWCPDNIEFIRRINGLSDADAVKQLVFDAHYLVMGLGDVYLGAPVATPLDPRHRLVTTKYNPARTWTAENSVGIGGAYMCIYGMEGPGGYQLLGRTLQMWNRYHQTVDFQNPWLLDFFDQIRFYPVSADELTSLRQGFLSGQHRLKIEASEFSLSDYQAFLTQQQDSIKAFEAQRQQAFDGELQHWIANDLLHFDSTAADIIEHSEIQLDDGQQLVESAYSGSVWQLAVAAGDTVTAGQTLMIVESMKMEIAVPCPADGYIAEVLKTPGQRISAGDALFILG